MTNKATELISDLFAKISAMDTRTRYLAFSGILVFFFFLDYMILMRPQLNALNKINPKIKTLAGDIKTTKENIQKIDYYKNEVERLKEKVADVSQRVRSKDEMSLILEEISQIANQSKVKIDQIAPKADDLKMLVENNKKDYFSLAISIEAKSGYHNLGRFLNHIENSDIFFSIFALNISPTDDPTTHSAKMTINAIVFDYSKPDKKPDLKGGKKN